MAGPFVSFAKAGAVHSSHQKCRRVGQVFDLNNNLTVKIDRDGNRLYYYHDYQNRAGGPCFAECPTFASGWPGLLRFCEGRGSSFKHGVGANQQRRHTR